MTTVLITQCLQRDFVDPMGLHDPLPNLLHVGYSEAAVRAPCGSSMSQSFSPPCPGLVLELCHR